jgi:hypothetical protein
MELNRKEGLDNREIIEVQGFTTSMISSSLMVLTEKAMRCAYRLSLNLCLMTYN